MANPQAPTEDQLAQTKAQADAKLAEWEGDFKEEDLSIPYKREETDEKKDTTEKGKSSIQDQTDEDSDSSSEEGAEDLGTEQYTEPESVVTLEDPGDFELSDYSFEIEIGGKTHKVSSAEEADELADKYADDLNAKQLGSLIRKGAQIEIKQERDKAEYDKRKAEYDSQVEEQANREKTVESFVKEFNYLVSKGLLPEIPKEYINADWQDPKIAKIPEVKAQMDVLTYMLKENTERRKAGVPEITSIIDAYNAMQNDPSNREAKETKIREEANQKVAGEQRKAAGARISGVSTGNQGTYVPKGIAVGNPNALRNNASLWDN